MRRRCQISASHDIATPILLHKHHASGTLLPPTLSGKLLCEYGFWPLGAVVLATTIGAPIHATRHAHLVVAHWAQPLGWCHVGARPLKHDHALGVRTVDTLVRWDGILSELVAPVAEHIKVDGLLAVLRV